jgi:hypothetical protein
VIPDEALDHRSNDGQAEVVKGPQEEVDFHLLLLEEVRQCADYLAANLIPNHFPVINTSGSQQSHPRNIGGVPQDQTP